jgi:carbon monoxide dehydrogenase subunit G
MADSTTSKISISVPRAAVMDVIADFESYPQWADGVKSAEILSRGSGGRADRVRFALDAGIIKDRFVLCYDWNGDTGVRWNLDPSEPGTVITELTGGYALDEQGAGTGVTYDLTIGLRIPVIGMLKRRAEKTIIDTALKGLKARAENGVGRS